MRRAALALAALVLAGCGSGGGADAGGPLRLQLWADPQDARAWEALVQAYGPGRVELTPVPDKDEHLQRLATAFAGGRPPDVVLVNHRDLGPFLRPGALAAPGADTAPLDRTALAAFSVGGEVVCAPLNTSSLVVYLNLERLRAAGVPAPAGGAWTYDAFLAAARRLRDAAGEGEHAVGIDPALIRAAPFVWSAGGELVRGDAFALREPAARRGLEALLRLRREGLTPSRREAQALGLEERFAAGDLGMLFTSRREVPAFRRLARFDWDVAGFPAIARPASVLHSDGLCVPAAGRRVAEAQRFVRFAAGPEGQAVLARAGRIVPSHRDVARSDAFLAPGERPASSQVFLDALPTLRALPTSRAFGRAEDEADLAIEEAFYGTEPLDAALARLDGVRVR